ncbi:hypothetical protein [Longispora albida]|nr:hypothetical protein [Longispora albida]
MREVEPGVGGRLPAETDVPIMLPAETDVPTMPAEAEIDMPAL